jgi:hypothetical protein
MAHKNPRTDRSELGNRAGLRGSHNSFAPVPLRDLHRPSRPCVPGWCELAVTAVALMCVAPALVVGFLLLLEAALPTANRCASTHAAFECAAEADHTTRTP